MSQSQHIRLNVRQFVPGHHIEILHKGQFGQNQSGKSFKTRENDLCLMHYSWEEHQNLAEVIAGSQRENLGTALALMGMGCLILGRDLMVEHRTSGPASTNDNRTPEQQTPKSSARNIKPWNNRSESNH